MTRSQLSSVRNDLLRPAQYELALSLLHTLLQDEAAAYAEVVAAEGTDDEKALAKRAFRTAAWELLDTMAGDPTHKLFSDEPYAKAVRLFNQIQKTVRQQDHTWFTADLHLDHANIIGYERRPFKDVQDMYRKLLYNWNSLVAPEDTIYVVGDLSLRGPQDNLGPIKRFLAKANGVKHLILGNHDRLRPQTYINLGFTSVHTALELHLPWGPTIYVAHDPACSRVKRDSLWLCGHVHSLFKVQDNVVNVGIDVWGYNPVSLGAVFAHWRNYHADK